MPLEVRHTRKARRDLQDIWRYISHNNAPAADKQLRHIAKMTDYLADLPEIGRPRPDLGPNLRSIPIDRYLLFYEVEEKALRVVRVLNSARHISPELFDT